MTAAEALNEAKSSERPIRVGILCDGGSLADWQVKVLDQLELLPFAEIVVRVMKVSADDQRPPLLTRLRRKLASGLLLWRVYERLVVNRKADAIQRRPFTTRLNSLPTIESTPVRSGKYRESLDDKTLSALRRYEVDVLLRFGFGILTGDILSVPRYGVWSFHHGDPERYRGAPPGFWEIHNGDAVTGVILQRLTDTLDGGIVLHRGWFKTNAASYPKALDRILYGAAHFVARALADVRRDPTLLEKPPLAQCGSIYRYPRTRAMLTFFRRTMQSWFANQFRSLFAHQQWTIGIVDKNGREWLDEIANSKVRATSVSWLPETKGRFLADPFVASSAAAPQECAILAEDFDWANDRGQIVSLEWATDIGPPRSAIQRGCHLSYPYAFEYAGNLYCVPEMAEDRRVTLFRLEPGERQWVAERTLIDGFPALDPTVFQHGGRWWLLCTSADTGPNEYLYCWYADDLTGPWLCHPCNPLKVDIRSARPAGHPFVHRGELIRPAQDCSRIYGGGITFNRVTKLTPDHFNEEPFGVLMPENQVYTAGLHTFCMAGDRTVVDGARLTFVGAEFRRALARKFRRR